MTTRRNGYILTTLMGSVGTAATIMAWMNLGVLPSKAGRTLYVVGESENGNDLDLQFGPDDVLRFYTAAGAGAWNIDLHQRRSLVNGI